MIRISQPSHLEHGDLAVVFPSLANLSPDGNHWHASVNGMVFREGKLSFTNKFLLGLLRRAMKVGREAFETEIFRSRIRGFLAEAARGKRLEVLIGQEIFPLARSTKRNGFFHEELSLVPGRLGSESESEHRQAVSFPVSLVTKEGDPVGLAGRLLLLPRRGVSVVSDIDDTLKVTSVHCRRTMLANTFLREFCPVVGMRELFDQWRANGADFHYVSSSPWQLFEPIQAYLKAAALPEGSIHLRSFRLQDHLLRRILFGRNPVKGAVIKAIMHKFPLRRFVFVGDSGEFDPEIYGSLARRFPQQVQGIFIRRVSGAKNPLRRFEKAFRQLPPRSWHLFDDPAEIPADAILG